jgi:predicted nucleotidyltransferase component of viral defense system
MTLETITHRAILLSILKDISSDSIMGSALGFKGGTAAYLFYGLSRFSVDLDFDLLDDKYEKYIFEHVQKILEKYGKVKQAREKRFNIFYLLSYENKVHGGYNIKVEINRRDFGSQYEIESYLGIPLKVMVKRDMAAHKLVAMFERLGTTNRDIFDVYFFLKNNWHINEAIVEKRTNMTFNEFLKKCISGLESMSDRDILSGLGELLDAQQKVWVKKYLRTETIFLLKARE